MTPIQRWILFMMIVLLGSSLGISSISVAQPAAGVTYTVTTLADTDASDGMCSLREAIQEAQHETDTDCPGTPSNGDDTIIFAVSGTIVLESPLPAIVGSRWENLQDPGAAEEIPFGALTIRGNGAITISGNRQHRVFTIQDRGSLTLESLTITDAVHPEEGGAIFAAHGAARLTIVDSRVTNCEAGYGGAIAGHSATVHIERSLFDANHATYTGGAIVLTFGRFTLHDSEFHHNTAYQGGAIWLHGVSLTEIITTVFTENMATDPPPPHDGEGNIVLFAAGGAIGITGRTEGGTVTIRNTTFRHNTALTHGGAMYAANVEQIVVDGSRFENNTAGSVGEDGEIAIDGDGGALWLGKGSNTPSMPPVITNSDFVNNWATALGGAILQQSDYPIVTVIERSRFRENRAGMDGGAISILLGSLEIRDSELTANRAGRGGGAISAILARRHTHTLSVSNTVFRANEADATGGALELFKGNARIVASQFIANRSLVMGGGLYGAIGSVEVVGSLFRENTAWAGGAITNRSGSLLVQSSSFLANTANAGGGIANKPGGTARIENSTFVGNVAMDGDVRHAGKGGAIFNTATLTVVATTLRANAADTAGGGIFNDTDPRFNGLVNQMTLVNTIITDSIRGGDCVSNERIASHHNLIGDPTSSCGDAERNFIGVDPRLGELTGDPPYLPLLADSPAIDAGDTAMCPGPALNGVPRPVGAACDIGAVEWTDDPGPPPTADTDRPELTAVQCLTPSSSTGTSVQIRLSFSEAVRNVDHTNVVVLGSPPPTTVTITDITAESETDYLVTVGAYGSYTGALTVTVRNDSSITDLAGNPLLPPSLTGGYCSVGGTVPATDIRVFVPLIVR